MVRESTKEVQSARPKRKPLHGGARLSVRDQDPNYVYRIVNTTDSSGQDRVTRFQEAGYELVETQNTVGETRVDVSTGLGSAPEISVGQGTKAIVMRIRKEWYNEDQSAKQREVDAAEETMHKNAKSKADYGNFEVSK